MFIKMICSWCEKPYDPEDVLEVQKGNWICRGCANKIKDYAAFKSIDLYNFKRKE